MSNDSNYPKIAQLRTVEALRARFSELGISLPIDDKNLSAANRDGSPTGHTLRRWRNFGRSGAKLIWGGEAAAVRPDGRANPNQTLATGSNHAGLTALLGELTNAHRAAFGSLD